MRKSVIISLGGSLIVNRSIQTSRLKKFRNIVQRYISEYRRIFIVTGGGMIARRYQNAAISSGNGRDRDLDLIGIAATRLNAELVRSIFFKNAYPEILTDPNQHVRIPQDKKIVVLGGSFPGWSTDYVSVCLAQTYKVADVLNLTNIDRVYDKDPKQFMDAKPFKVLTWRQYRSFVPKEWIPGANLPFDPIAAKKAQKLGLTVYLMSGARIEKVKRYFEGKNFLGTIIGDQSV